MDSWLGMPEAVVIALYPSSLDPVCMDPARIELAASPNGVDMQMGMYYYEDKAAFQAAQGVLKVNELQDLFNGAADLEQSESQSVQLASEKVKAQLEAKGYTVAIVDL